MVSERKRTISPNGKVPEGVMRFSTTDRLRAFRNEGLVELTSPFGNSDMAVSLYGYGLRLTEVVTSQSHDERVVRMQRALITQTSLLQNEKPEIVQAAKEITRLADTLFPEHDLAITIKFEAVQPLIQLYGKFVKAESSSSEAKRYQDAYAQERFRLLRMDDPEINDMLKTITQTIQTSFLRRKHSSMP